MSNAEAPLAEMKETCASLTEVKAGDVNDLAAKLWKLSINYFENVRRQAQQSFYSALIVALLGIGFFFLALLWMMQGKVPYSKLALTAGMTIQIISAIGFYLYAKTSHQFSEFHMCLERANRYLLANTMCEALKDESSKDEMRKELIRIVALAPILSFDLIEHGERATNDEPGNPPIDGMPKGLLPSQ